MPKKFRIEQDTLGEVRVPREAYYGAQTQRARENFSVSGLRTYPELIKAFALIKKAAAQTHSELGLLDIEKAKAISAASDEVIAGKLDDQFVVDIFQAGAGTSTNMNLNEVIANRAGEMLGSNRGDYSTIHPNDHVNMGQSTNDTYPTAMRIAALFKLQRLNEALEKTIHLMNEKALEFKEVLKTGRTHLQDAAPISLGIEFGGYRDSLKKDKLRLLRSSTMLEELNIGGTAVGTGLNAQAGYVNKMTDYLAQYSELDLRPATNLVEIMQSMADLAGFSSSLRVLALDLTRIANDLRLLSSGPTSGLMEIRLPPTQPGSSIMPGKVNPSILECLNQICFQVLGCCTTIDYCVQAGQLELNVMMPIISWNIMHSEHILATGLEMLNERCLGEITADEDHCLSYHEKSMGLATVLNPIIGYEKAAEIVKQAIAEKRTIKEIVLNEGLLTAEEWEGLFRDLKSMK